MSASPSTASTQQCQAARHAQKLGLSLPCASEPTDASPAWVASNALDDAFCRDYASDLILALLEREQEFYGSTAALALGKGLAPEIRVTAVKWMLDAAEQFQLDAECTAFAVNYFDRYTAVISVSKSLVQLLAATCLLIAGKTDGKDLMGLTPSALSQLVIDVSGRTCYSVQDFMLMELHILKVLQWRIYPATAASFIALMFKMLPFDDVDNIIALCQRIVELVLTDCALVALRPSQAAVAAVLLAFDLLQRNSEASAWMSVWSKEFPALFSAPLHELMLLKNHLLASFSRSCPNYCPKAAHRELTSPTSVDGFVDGFPAASLHGTMQEPAARLGLVLSS